MLGSGVDSGTNYLLKAIMFMKISIWMECEVLFA